MERKERNGEKKHLEDTRAMALLHGPVIAAPELWSCYIRTERQLLRVLINWLYIHIQNGLGSVTLAVAALGGVKDSEPSLSKPDLIR